MSSVDYNAAAGDPHLHSKPHSQNIDKDIEAFLGEELGVKGAKSFDDILNNIINDQIAKQETHEQPKKRPDGFMPNPFAQFGG